MRRISSPLLPSSRWTSIIPMNTSLDAVGNSLRQAWFNGLTHLTTDLPNSVNGFSQEMLLLKNSRLGIKRNGPEELGEQCMCCSLLPGLICRLFIPQGKERGFCLSAQYNDWWQWRKLPPLSPLWWKDQTEPPSLSIWYHPPPSYKFSNYLIGHCSCPTTSWLLYQYPDMLNQY